jgi:hypothetical protein
MYGDIIQPIILTDASPASQLRTNTACRDQLHLQTRLAETFLMFAELM